MKRVIGISALALMSCFPLAHTCFAQNTTDDFVLPPVEQPAPEHVKPEVSAPPTGLLKPGAQDNETLSYATGIDELHDNWHMLYGPLHGKDKTIRYSIQRPNGFLIFSCSSDGREEMALGIAGLTRKSGESVTVPVTVSDVQHDMTFLATQPASSKAQETVFYASGSDVEGVLNTLSRIHSEKAMQNSMTIQFPERGLYLPSPVPYQEAATASRICAQWHNKSILPVESGG